MNNNLKFKSGPELNLFFNFYILVNERQNNPAAKHTKKAAIAAFFDNIT